MQKMKKILIEYDGEYPNLCSGHLKVWLGNDFYDFGQYCLSSGGSCYFENDYADEVVKQGEWSINEYSIPENFPEEYLDDVLKVINEEITWGCCGGCL